MHYDSGGVYEGEWRAGMRQVCGCGWVGWLCLCLRLRLRVWLSVCLCLSVSVSVSLSASVCLCHRAMVPSISVSTIISEVSQ